MKKRALALLLASVMTAGLVAGCGNDGSNNQSANGGASASEDGGANDGGANDTGEIVELNFYMRNSPVVDQERIMEKAKASVSCGG